MADAFISYSRRDQAFVRRLHDALAARGRDTWVDWESIPLTAEWEAEIYAGIDAAQAFVYVLSPDSIASEICARELAHAVRHQKRLVPLVCREVDPATVPPALAALNWIFCRDGDAFDRAVDGLLAAMDTDLEHVRRHTRLLVRALEWERKGNDGSLLLRGGDLREAEQWLLAAGEREPRPTPLQTQYLVAGRRAETARQRALFGGVTVALVVALALGVLAWVQRGEALAAQGRAERRFNDVRQLANAFMFEFHDAVANLPGATPARRLVVERALEYLDGLAAEAGGDPGLQRELLVAYNRVGDVQGNPNTANLGDLDGALESYRRSLAIAERLARADPTGSKAQRDLAVGYGKIGQIQQAGGDVAGALASHRQALAVYERLAAADPADAQAQRDLAFGYEQLGDLQGNPNSPNVGDPAGARESFWRALEIRERLAAIDSGNAADQRQLSVAYTKIGEIQEAGGDPAGALESYRRALAIDERLAAADPHNVEIQRDLAVGYSKVGEVQLADGDREGASESFRRSLEIRERLAAADPDDARARRDLSIGYERLGWVQQVSGDAVQALGNYRHALEIRERLAAADPANAVAQRDLAAAHTGIGDAQLASGDAAGALESYRRSLAIDERLAAANPANAGAQRDLAIDYAKLGSAQRAAGDAPGALASRRRLLEILERSVAADASDARARRVLAFEYNETCWAAALDGLAREVLPECERAVELAPEGDVAKYRDSRGLARALAGDPAGAIEDFRAVVEWARPRDPGERFTAKRQAWIAALEAGRDPFDIATVSDLRAQ